MKANSRPVLRRGLARWQGVLALAGLLQLTNVALASTVNDEEVGAWTGTYAGVFIGSGQAENRVVDQEGFSDWGNPGATRNYDEDGLLGGVLIGKKFDLDGVPFRLEFDGTFGDLSAKTDKLDPKDLDETARTEFRWIATARAGIEQPIGFATLFISGGIAVARIENSVTDIDFGPDMPDQVDPDDSFHDNSTEIGWVVDLGIEALLSDTWTLRLEGSYLDFGQETHYLNHSGNNRCGPGKPRRPCPYDIENKLSSVRLAIFRRF